MANKCKYYKEKQQVSYDFGVTWLDTGSYRKGNLYEYQSSDCPEPHDYANDYLTFVAEESGTMRFKASNRNNLIYYSTDSGSTWSQGSSAVTVSVSSGDTIMWKGEMTPYYVSEMPYRTYIGQFSSSGSFEAQGNPMSLLYGDNFSGQTSLSGKNYAFSILFSGCTSLTTAENLVLPATTLSNSCYGSMFQGCTSLTTAPELPATTLATNCYGSMFQECTNLTTAPELPATTLVSNCYSFMFTYCTNLNYIKCLATDISASSCTYAWVYGVNSSGTFVTPSSTNWESGLNGIPDGWTRVNA